MFVCSFFCRNCWRFLKIKNLNQRQLLCEIVPWTYCWAEGNREASHESGVIPATSAGRTPEQTRPEVEPHCTSTFLCAEVITEVLKLSLFLLCINLNSETKTLYVTKIFYCPLNKLCGPASSGGSFTALKSLQFRQLLNCQSIKMWHQRSLAERSHWKQATSGQHLCLLHETLSICCCYCCCG